MDFGTAVVQMIGNAWSKLQTVEAEEATPTPVQPPDYTEIEKVVAGMLQESTGTHILDSGSAYGRHWQANRRVTDFRKQPPLNAQIWDNGEVIFSIDIFHYLTSMLEIDDRSKALQEEFAEYANKPENEDVSWLALMEEFAGGSAWNTYNWETLLSQVLQGVNIDIEEDGEQYILLQIHNGCDVRGGYTAPRIFRVIDSDYFQLYMSQASAGCKCTYRSTDDCGYHWYGDEFDKGERPASWKAQPLHPLTLWQQLKGYAAKVLPQIVTTPDKPKAWEYKLVCSKCGKDVEFWADLDF